jgi:hypothetical protein
VVVAALLVVLALARAAGLVAVRPRLAGVVALPALHARSGREAGAMSVPFRTDVERVDGKWRWTIYVDGIDHGGGTVRTAEQAFRQAADYLWTVAENERHADAQDEERAR